MKAKIILGIITICFSSASSAYIVDGSRINQPKMLSYAKHKLENYGTIQQTPDGFTYVKISDRYVSELIRQISRPGFEVPKSALKYSVSGAHISVIKEGEAKEIGVLQELGQRVNFNPLGFYTVVLHDQEYFMLAVDAPELSSLRKKYGLPERLENHAFHITIGVRQLTSENELANPEEYVASNS